MVCIDFKQVNFFFGNRKVHVLSPQKKTSAQRSYTLSQLDEEQNLLKVYINEV